MLIKGKTCNTKNTGIQYSGKNSFTSSHK